LTKFYHTLLVFPTGQLIKKLPWVEVSLYLPNTWWTISSCHVSFLTLHRGQGTYIT
jgi:hypothetical protein